MLFYLLRFTLALSLSLAVGFATPAFAKGATGGGRGGSGVGGNSGGVGLSNATTKQVTKSLKRGIRGCMTLDKVYRFDCFRQTYRLSANMLNGNPAYRDAQAALISVEQALDQIVASNIDPKTPRARKGFQQFTPIKPAAVPKATADLTRALDEAETMLLRSSDRAGVHNARIAEAIHSNKVLLRSLLRLHGLIRSWFA